MGHVSCVTCHQVSRVRCQVSDNFCFFYKVVGLVGGGSVINGATPSSFNGTWLRYIFKGTGSRNIFIGTSSIVVQENYCIAFKKQPSMYN